MPRYEFTEGSSSKFWDISLDGSSFTTTYGRIGSDGQSKTKSFGSAAEAKKEHDKLVASKVKKGYVLVGGDSDDGGGGGDTPVHASNPELEAAIVENPENLEAYAVLCDWLLEQGDPRGELMSLQLHGDEKKAKKLLAKHRDYFLGPLAEHEKVHDEGWNNAASHLRTREQEKAWQKTQREAFLWRLGYIDRVRLSHDEYSDEEFDGKTVDLLEMVLEHPSGRFIREFAFQSNGDPNEDDLQDLIDMLGKKAPPTTRKITFGDNIDQISWHHTGNLDKLWKGVPNLRVLEIETGEFDVGKMNAPMLERAVFITGGLSPSCGRNIATAKMPNIKHLEIYYGDDNYGGDCTIADVLPLLERSDLEHLEYLGLENAMFQDDIARALAGAKVLATVKTLDLSGGALTDQGVEAILAAKSSMKNVECIDVTHSYLTPDGVKALQKAFKKVIAADQQEPDDWGDGEMHYYVSVAE